MAAMVVAMETDMEAVMEVDMVLHLWVSHRVHAEVTLVVQAFRADLVMAAVMAAVMVVMAADLVMAAAMVVMAADLVIVAEKSLLNKAGAVDNSKWSEMVLEVVWHSRYVSSKGRYLNSELIK